jgi:hypothetical protein
LVNFDSPITRRTVNGGTGAATGDFAGAGKFDTAVFRPADTNRYLQKRTGGFTIQQFGASGDLPVPAGYIP